MAQLTNIDQQVQGFFKIKTIGSFLKNFLQITLAIGAITAFLYLLWGGLEYIASGGNQDRTKSAKEKITQALTGLAILAAAWALWRLTVYFLGISPSASGPFRISIPKP